MKILGIDVGGTFVDFVYFDSDARHSKIQKRSRGPDVAQTMVDGVKELCDATGIDPGDIDLVIHGTTVATNALLEHDGARTGMLTTEGFRDITHIGRHQRPSNYSMQFDIPWQSKPLVKRRHRLTIPERCLPPEGEVLRPLDEDAVRAAVSAMIEDGVESIAINFLFSYLNPSHEQRAAEIVREMSPDTYVCTSSEVVPQFREFERFTTTAINAFVGPVVKTYIENLEMKLKDNGITASLHIMQSNGGTANVDMAAKKPVTLLLSGPVGGVMGGVWAAENVPGNLATLDIGGTSADIGIVTEEGIVEARSRDTWIAGFPLMVPIVDIETIATGGGSIASVDQAGALRVGPRSAGSIPGPAAYGRGGTEATLTDANVVLGRLPSNLAGGLQLDREASERAVGKVAEALGMSLQEAAEGIVRLANEDMAAALRSRTIARGLDPREFLLCPMGGAGPLQAADVAAILDIPKVLNPPNPGVTSAAGLLTSDLRYDSSTTVLKPADAVDMADLQQRFVDSERQLCQQLVDDGCSETEIKVDWALDLRYMGQSFELKVALQTRKLDESVVADIKAAFHRTHHEEYGQSFPELPVELVNLRLTAVGPLPHIEHTLVSGGTLEKALLDEQAVTFRVDGKLASLPTKIYRKEDLPVNVSVQGPAIIVQEDTTTLVRPDDRFCRDQWNNLIIDVQFGRGE